MVKETNPSKTLSSGVFTGIIEHVGTLVASTPIPAGRRIIVDAGPWTPLPRPGDSIAVQGVCLTLLADLPRSPTGSVLLAFDVVPETLGKTHVGDWKPGRRLHLELAATPSTPLGGHIVQGHVDALGSVSRVQRGDDWRLSLSLPEEIMPAMVPKGSVAIEGVSLTLARVHPPARQIEVALIPATLARTTLSALVPGDSCHVEADILAKTVAHVVKYYIQSAPGRSP